MAHNGHKRGKTKRPHEYHPVYSRSVLVIYDDGTVVRYPRAKIAERAMKRHGNGNADPKRVYRHRPSCAIRLS